MNNVYSAVFNREARDTYWWVLFGLMLESHDGDMGKGDCIGRSFDAFIAYLEYAFLDAVKELWVKNEEGKYYGERFPGYDMVARPMSRDHLIATILLAYYTKDYDYLSDFIKNTPFKIDRDRHTIDGWAWKYAIIGNKWYEVLYYAVNVPLMIFTTVKEKIVRPILGVKKERTQKSWDKDYPQSVSDRKRWWMRKLLFPTYALIKQGWMISALRPSYARTFLKWICRPQMGHTNYWAHMLYGRPVDRMNLLRYQPMTGDRPTCDLDIRNDRHCVIIKNKVWLQYNRLDKDLGLAMWEMFQGENKIA